MKEKITGHQHSQPEHTQPLQGRAEGKQSLQGPTTFDSSEQPQPSRERGQISPSLPITTQEQPKPQPESVLSRALERTRDLYERNGWVFLPLGEAGKPSPKYPEQSIERLTHLNFTPCLDDIIDMLNSLTMSH